MEKRTPVRVDQRRAPRVPIYPRGVHHIAGLPHPARVMVLDNFLLLAGAPSRVTRALSLTCSGTALVGVLCGMGLFLTAPGTALTGGTSLFAFVLLV